MTTDQKREAIVRECVEANPDLVTMQTFDGRYDTREIRLADVLRTVYVDPAAPKEAILERVGKQWGEVLRYWNLRQDDLDLQGDECIDALHRLLCK